MNSDLLETVIASKSYGLFFIDFVIYIDEVTNTSSYGLEKYQIDDMNKNPKLVKKYKYDNYADIIKEWKEINNILCATIRMVEGRGIENE